MPAGSSAALIATAPRAAAEKSFSEPSRRPIGVRAPPTMTERGWVGWLMTGLQCRAADAGDRLNRAYRADRAPVQDRTTSTTSDRGAGDRPREREPCHIELSSQTSWREDAREINS